MKTNPVLIEKIIYPGVSLCRQQPKTLLTDSGLPGESVEVEILGERKNHLRARTVGIRAASAHRVPPRCDHFQVCSAYQYIDYPEQLRIKTAQLQEFLQHSLTPPLPEIVCRPAAQLWEYRNKAHVHLIRRDGRLLPAYHLPRQHDQFMPFERCWLLSEQSNRILSRISAALDPFALHTAQTTIRTNRAGQCLIALYTAERLSAAAECALLSALQNEQPAGVLVRDNTTVRFRTLWGEDALTETIYGIDLRFGIASFFQINLPLLNEMMADLLRELSLGGGEQILDAYCGVGTFGLVLAEQAAGVNLLESDHENLRYLQENIRRAKRGNVCVRAGHAERLLRRHLRRRPDLIIVDPPRRGLSADVTDALLSHPTPSLVYISCDPATLMRDIKRLQAAYRVKKIYWYDFFTHTPHWETMALLESNR